MWWTVWRRRLDSPFWIVLFSAVTIALLGSDDFPAATGRDTAVIAAVRAEYPPRPDSDNPPR